MQQAVGSLLQLDERAELRGLHDLPRELIADLGLLRQRFDRGDRRLRLRALGRIDEDRAVLLDVDLHLVLGLERTDGLAALSDHHADLLGVDLDRRDPRRGLGQLRPHLRDCLQHLVEDERTRILRLLECALHDLSRDSRDLDVHLQCGDAVSRAGDLEVHVAEMVLGTLDVREDHVVIALLHEPHRDPRDGCLDGNARIHERECRAAHGTHRRRAVRFKCLRDQANRVRKLVRRRNHRLERTLCERTVSDVAPLRAAHHPRLAHRVRGEVVVVHVAAVGLERQVVDPLSLLRRAEREQRHDLRLAAREQARAVRAR